MTALREFSPASILATVARDEAILKTQHKGDLVTFVVFFDTVERETQFIPFMDPDIFYEDVTRAVKDGWVPVATQLSTEDFEQCRGFIFFSEPNAEDQAIMAGTFLLPGE